MELTTTIPPGPGQRLRSTRLAMPLDYRTQAAFGSLTGYSDSTLSRFEKAGRPVPVGLRNMLRLLDHVLKTMAPADVDAFLAGFECSDTEAPGAAAGAL